LNIPNVNAVAGDAELVVICQLWLCVYSGNSVCGADGVSN